MVMYNSDSLEFRPIDIKTPEGREKMIEIIRLIMRARTRKPEKKPRVIIHYDENGIFSEPEYAEDSECVLVCVPSPEYGKDPYHLAFLKKFCSLRLKRENGGNNIKFVMQSRFHEIKEKDYRAIIWIKSDEELPDNFEGKSGFYAIDSEKRPVFVIGAAILKACKGLDMESPAVECRMKHIIENCREKEDFICE